MEIGLLPWKKVTIQQIGQLSPKPWDSQQLTDSHKKSDLNLQYLTENYIFMIIFKKYCYPTKMLQPDQGCIKPKVDVERAAELIKQLSAGLDAPNYGNGKIQRCRPVLPYSHARLLCPRRTPLSYIWWLDQIIICDFVNRQLLT